MKSFLNKAAMLLSILIVISGAGVIILKVIETDIAISEFLLLTAGFGFYTLVIISIFEYGRARKPEKTGLFSLLSVVLKFLFPMIIALIWFLVFKKSSTTGLIIFFVLYLAFTVFLTRALVKTLKESDI